MIDPEEEKLRRDEDYRAYRAAYGVADARMAREHDITGCHLCDDDGYRGGTVCDHTDHTAAAKRGMDLIRESMGWTTP